MRLALAGAACLLALPNVAVAAAAGGPTGATGATGSTGSTGSTGASGALVANPSISLNWAGYAVTGTGGAVRRFKSVTGSWVAPAVTCTPGSSTYSAFWVGIGGLARSSAALEQTGTEADCDSRGVPHYSAWYELVPAGPVTVKLTVSPGDAMTGSVTVASGYVTVRLLDATSGASFERRLRFRHPDTSSAEWIAEAPSTCHGGSCSALPLSDFGTVDFAAAGVHTVRGLTGTIADPRWVAEAIALKETSSSTPGARLLAQRAAVTASPTVLADTGSAFAVTWAQAAQSAPTGPGGRVFPGF